MISYGGTITAVAKKFWIIGPRSQLNSIEDRFARATSASETSPSTFVLPADVTLASARFSLSSSSTTSTPFQPRAASAPAITVTFKSVKELKGKLDNVR